MDAPECHVEPCRDVSASIRYCTKAESRVSEPVFIGDVPAEKGNLRDRLASGGVKQYLVESPEKWRWIKQLNSLRNLFSEPRCDVTVGYWMFGPTGSGKTKTAMSLSHHYGKVYFKDSTQWWDGYENEPLVVVDDFRGEWRPDYILRLIDRYPLRVQTKGGYVNFNSQCVVFTSNLRLAECFAYVDQESINALNRRIVELEIL